MICNMTLKSSDDELLIVLKDDSEYKLTQATKCAYQDKNYSITMSFSDIAENYVIDQVELYLNNKPLRTYFEKTTADYRCSNGTFFSTLFGFAQFSVKVYLNGYSECILFSEYLVVAIKHNEETEEIEKSLTKMIDSIYSTDQSLMYQSGSQQRVYDNRGVGESIYKTLDADISLLKTVINVYSQNLIGFSKKPYGKTRKTLVVDDFEKVNIINNKVIHYIISHQEQISVSNSKEGFRLGRKYYYPQKSLVEESITDTNVYENQIVVSFLKFILFDVKNKLESVQTLINQSIKISIDVKNDYILSSSIIYKLTHFRIQLYLDKLKDIQAHLQSLYLQYKRILPCDEIIIGKNSLPIPTNIIYTKQHYRNVYDTILKWFKSGDCLYSQDKVLMNFVTADQIFEYYCLISIVNVFKTIGFNLSEKTNKIYDIPDKRYSNIGVKNYFKFSNGNVTAHLYYQPVIYSDNTYQRHEIDLFRVDGNYYTPDFIIKFCYGNQNEYLIMDSKWSKRKNILNDYFEDVVYKYGLVTRNINNIHQMSNVWILQGKNDYPPRKKYFLNQKDYAINNNESFNWQYGIVTATPENNDELKDLINFFVQKITNLEM